MFGDATTLVVLFLIDLLAILYKKKKRGLSKELQNSLRTSNSRNEDPESPDQQQIMNSSKALVNHSEDERPSVGKMRVGSQPDLYRNSGNIIDEVSEKDDSDNRKFDSDDD